MSGRIPKKVVWLIAKQVSIYAVFIALFSTLLGYIWDPDKGADIILTACGVFSFLFAALYFLRSNWWVEPVGRAMMAGSLFFSFILLQNSFSSWTNQGYAYRSEIRLVLYAALFCSGFKLVSTLWYIQSKSSKERDGSD